jgi:hypothetical protein
MPPAGFYKTNYRAMRLRECIRISGFRRGLRFFFNSRFMKPGGGTWMPNLWTEGDCLEQDLSEEFQLAAKPHRKDFEDLGFTVCRFGKIKSLNPRIRDTGSIFYLDASRHYFGQIIYYRSYRGKVQGEVNEIIIAMTAVFESRSFSCTNNRKAFDTLGDSEVLRLNSYDVKFIHQQFLQQLQKRAASPRQFPDVESLQKWFDARQLKNFEERVQRRLFVPMSETEVAETQARRQSGAPPIPIRRTSVPRNVVIWMIIFGGIVALQFFKNQIHPRGSNTLEYQGQKFKMRMAYPSYEDYKDDPNNLDTNELDRIEQVMTNAPVPATFRDRKEFIHSMTFNLRFPGYGEGGFETETDDGSTLEAETVEIPQRDKERVIVVRQTTGPLNLVDDFIWNNATNEISAAKLEKQTLRYYDSQNRLLREKQL